jgi:hypothetical protein
MLEIHLFFVQYFRMFILYSKTNNFIKYLSDRQISNLLALKKLFTSYTSFQFTCEDDVNC